jgi:hypothetical protein
MAANFTGIWKLIRGESEFGFLGAPASRQDAILHEGSRICIRTRQKDSNGDVTVERDLIIGGEPVTVQIYGRPREVRAFWDEDTLVIETRSEVSGKPRRIEDRWTLDPDGQWITIDRVHEQPGGDVRQRLRLEKR